MSRSTKNTLKNGALFEAQYEMCFTVYAKLLELMHSVCEYSLEIEINNFKFQLSINTNPGHENTINFYSLQKSGGKNNIGYVNMKKISTTHIECPIIIYFGTQKELQNNKSTVYLEWLEKIKQTMQALLDKEKQYLEIIENIKSLPLFSPTREVLLEKH